MFCGGGQVLDLVCGRLVDETVDRLSPVAPDHGSGGDSHQHCSGLDWVVDHERSRVLQAFREDNNRVRKSSRGFARAFAYQRPGRPRESLILDVFCVSSGYVCAFVQGAGEKSFRAVPHPLVDYVLVQTGVLVFQESGKRGFRSIERLVMELVGVGGCRSRRRWGWLRGRWSRHRRWGWLRGRWSRLCCWGWGCCCWRLGVADFRLPHLVQFCRRFPGRFFPSRVHSFPGKPSAAFSQSDSHREHGYCSQAASRAGANHDGCRDWVDLVFLGEFLAELADAGCDIFDFLHAGVVPCVFVALLRPLHEPFPELFRAFDRSSRHVRRSSRHVLRHPFGFAQPISPSFVHDIVVAEIGIKLLEDRFVDGPRVGVQEGENIRSSFVVEELVERITGHEGSSRKNQKSIHS